MDSASLAAMGYYAAEEDKLRRERQEQNNPIDAIGKTALAAGAIAAAILGGRRLGGLKNTSSTVDLSNINPNAVRRAAGRPPVDLNEIVVPSRTPPPVVRTAPKSTLERLGDQNEFIRQAREERPQGITFVSQLGEEPVINTPQIIVPKTTTKETPTGQGFGLDYLNSLLGRKPAVEEVTRQARNERSQGIPFLDLSDEVRTSVDPWSGKETILTPFGSPTVPPVRTTETTTRGTQLLSPTAPDAADRLLNDPDLLRRVNKEYNVEQEAKELAIDNLLSSNRSEQARQQAQARRAITESGDEIISSLRSEANTAQAAAQGDYAQQYLKTAGYKDADTMVDLQVSNTPRNIDQTLNAIDAAEDQQTGRVYQQLQRNEGLDLNQIEIMEERAEINRMLSYEADAPINQVASQLPDGLPADQAEGLNLKTGRRYETYDEIPPIPPYKSSMLNPVTESYRREINRLKAQPNTEYVFNPPPEETPRLTGTSAIRFMEAEREKISGELAAKGIAALPRDIEAELANRLGPKASSYGPKYTARAQAMQTVANTGDPIAAETIKKFGLQPVTFETSNDPNPKPVTSYLKAGLFEYPISDIIPDEANRQQYLASKVAKNMPVEQQRLFNTRAPMSLEGYPSETLQVAMDPTGIMVNAPGYGVVDIAELRKPVIMGGTARQADDFINTALQGKQEYIEDFTSNIEGLKQEIYTERKERILQTGKELRLKQNQAKERGQVNTVRELEDQIQTLLKAYNNPELGDYREFGEGGIRQLDARVRGAIKENNQQIQELEKKYPTTLANRTGEGSRIFGQRNVDTGEFIPETMEVRSDRSDVDLGRRGGGGRNISEYAAGARPEYSRESSGTPPLFKKVGEKLVLVKPAGLKSNIRNYDIETGGAPQVFEDDRSGSGRVIDQYGIRLAGEKGANPTRRPSEPSYTRAEIKGEIARANEPIRYEEAVQRLGAQPATEAGRRSINASEEILRIQRSNPPAKAQALVSSFLQQLKGA
tara:strand:+ start:2178 stop:5171 length:2994 start_codon:yes stop_codon:yes gene_type:complete